MLWNLNTEKDRIWINWVNHYYMKNCDVVSFMSKQSTSWTIKAMFKHRDTLFNSATWNQFVVTCTYRTRVMFQELRGAKAIVPL